MIICVVRFWGWGREDDDFHGRVKASGFQRYDMPAEMGKYLALPHKRAVPSKDRWTAWKQGSKQTQREKGLLQANYQLVQVIQTSVYTQIRVNL